MKKLLFIIALMFTVSISTISASSPKPTIEPTTIEQLYFPGNHYSHKACCLNDILINGWWHHAYWTKYSDNFGNYYWSFVWVLNLT